MITKQRTERGFDHTASTGEDEDGDEERGETFPTGDNAGYDRGAKKDMSEETESQQEKYGAWDFYLPDDSADEDSLESTPLGIGKDTTENRTEHQLKLEHIGVDLHGIGQKVESTSNSTGIDRADSQTTCDLVQTLSTGSNSAGAIPSGRQGVLHVIVPDFGLVVSYVCGRATHAAIPRCTLCKLDEAHGD